MKMFGRYSPIFTIYILRFIQLIIFENFLIITFFFVLTYQKKQEFDAYIIIYEKAHTNKQKVIENLSLLKNCMDAFYNLQLTTFWVNLPLLQIL
jgi:hypothetical protein